MDRERSWSALDAADDGIIAGRAMDGDVAAFAVLVRRYTPLMRAYTQRMLNASAEVDDIVQESFVTAWQRLPELDDPAKVKSWLMRIVSNKAVDRLRALRPTADIDEFERPAPAHASPSRVVEARAEVEALGAALRELPDAQRECWVLREIGGYSYDEIAEELGIPVTTARGLLARARKYIIVRMEEWR
ncbi:RNA polymerase sigma factor [Microbacterium sp. SD291]|uniref:RNA polymerase sigma factor n=1 Tax=Microbacterium sp. SD291 TaxID=2782007 RepID=UPI001A95D8CC|nr:sigma-70 family RNA polymerase sigma factor [Microbacterium sp. SD291]MBO0981915.1 sigma-70 family RNA polymerase sigma factor [Microbacterium sp. SD291]